MKRALLLALTTATLAHAQTPNVLSLLAQQVSKTSDTATQKNILRGMNAALQGRTNLVAPPEWDGLAKQLAASPDAEVRELALNIGIVFGTKDALDALRTIAADTKVAAPARQRALEALIAKKDASTAPILRDLLGKPSPLRIVAIRGLATYDAADTADLLLAAYRDLSPEEKRDAVATLGARPAWAKQLTVALDTKRIPRTDFSASLVRQLRGYKDAAIDPVLDREFGTLAGNTDLQGSIAKYKEWITQKYVTSGDPRHGREVFTRTCAVCHKLFGEGADIGPELTGANRTDIDYLLQNVVDPNALIGADYQLNLITLKDGRVIAGMIRGENANTLTVRTMTEQMILSKGDIQTRTISPTSMMPEGLLSVLPKEDARDLFRYLGSPQQVPLP